MHVKIVNRHRVSSDAWYALAAQLRCQAVITHEHAAASVTAIMLWGCHVMQQY